MVRLPTQRQGTARAGIHTFFQQKAAESAASIPLCSPIQESTEGRVQRRHRPFRESWCWMRGRIQMQRPALCRRTMTDTPRQQKPLHRA
eukprot:3425692-Ditylum_brightwellii.AAC.1